MNLYGTAYRALGALAESILVLRRASAIAPDGRVHTDRIAPFRYNVRAIVVPTDPADLQRSPEYEMLRQAIEVTTDFALQGPSSGVEPDEVVWHGTVFMVNNILPMSKAGTGFVTAVCVATVQPKPPQIGALPNRVFPATGSQISPGLVLGASVLGEDSIE